MALSEIEKLERRYAENPQGLTFAPLAEVHRKNGDVTRALELLRPGLTHHPDYIPASIVLGRCHLDLGELPAAETAFTHVLGLDGENVIALKALADITERQGRFDEAERWLRTLLTIDRSNDEARDQLGRVEATRRQTSTAALLDIPDTSGQIDLPAADAAPPDHSPDPAVAAETSAVLEHAPLDLTPPPAHDAPAEHIMGWVAESGSVEAAGAVPLNLEELDIGVERRDEMGAEGPRPEGIELEQPATLEDTVTPLAGLVGREDGLDVGSFDHASDFRVEMAEDIVLNSSGGSEFQMADASEELLAMRQSPAPPPAPPEPSPVVESVFGAVDEPVPAAMQDDTTFRTTASSGVTANEASEPATTEHASDEIGIGESGAPATTAAGEATASEPASEPMASEPSSMEPAAEEPITAEAPVPEWARPMSPIAEDRPEPPASDWMPPWSRPREPEPADESVASAASSWSPPVAEPPVAQPLDEHYASAAAPAELPVSEPVPPAEPDLVVTASMAELLLQQGHPVEALTVYRLLETQGGMHRYTEKIAELERLTAPPEPPAPAPRSEPVPSAPLPAYSVQLTQGQSAQAFLKGVLTARPPAVSPGAAVHAGQTRPGMAHPEGAPTRPAHDSLSLSSVFGEESTPTMPAVSAGGAAAPAGGVSYDEFFGGAGSAAAPRPARAPDPKSDDLDQFHAWLQNLKR